MQAGRRTRRPAPMGWVRGWPGWSRSLTE